MDYDQRKEIYERLTEQNGRSNQIIKAIEEMSELIKELTKLLGKDTYTNNKNICDEIADAKIILEQLALFFDKDNTMIDTIMDFKLKRLLMFYLKPMQVSIKSEAEIQESLSESIYDILDSECDL